MTCAVADPGLAPSPAIVRVTDRTLWLAIGAAALLGFAIRLASAQGALWLDEAWSVIMVRDAGTPLGVMLWINHDNNHHLNSIWLSLVGIEASPPVARLLSIVTGSIAVIVAAAIGARHGRVVAIVTALAFAICPVLVTMGSEARGYAPMTLALLTAIWIVDRWLQDDGGTRWRTGLAVTFALGLLSQLTMAFGICAIGGWAFVTQWRRIGFAPALKVTLEQFTPAIIAVAITAAIVFMPGWLTGTGFQFGDYKPFDTLQYLHAIVEILGYMIGFPTVSLWLLPAAVAAVILARGAGVTRLPLYWFAVIGFPLALAILQSGNPGHPRYYLVVVVALLLLGAEAVSRGLTKDGSARWIAATALALFTIGSTMQNVDLITNQRGDVGAAIRAMAARSPEGGRVLVDRPTATAMLVVSAAEQGYDLTIPASPCPAERFLLVDRFKGEKFMPVMHRCGHSYVPIASAQAHGMSGTHWTLYETRL